MGEGWRTGEWRCGGVGKITKKQVVYVESGKTKEFDSIHNP